MRLCIQRGYASTLIVRNFVELSTQAYNNFAPKESGCFQFQIIRQDGGGSAGDEQSRAIIERYASKEHLAHHRSTESSRLLFETLMAEERLSGSPLMLEGQAVEMGHRNRQFND
ncbi:hypothetical protein BST61_g58 [Cercospora zeina]